MDCDPIELKFLYLQYYILYIQGFRISSVLQFHKVLYIHIILVPTIQGNILSIYRSDGRLLL